nr:cytochrome c biogenesis protein ccs1, chloroplastic [Quercus suber]
MKGEGGLELGNSAEMISAELAVGNSAELEISESAEDDVGMWESKVLTSLKVLGVLSNLPLAIGEMFAVAALMALGLLC